jgi:hypothetical protein
LSVEAVLQLTTQILADLEIPYMVTGSLASAFYGEPRSTQDVDVVVSAPEGRLQALGARLRDAGLYCDAGAIREAADLRGLFNAIDPATGWKIDFIVLGDHGFYRTAFEARREAQLGGVPLTVIRAEDIAVAKLEWSRLAGGSERQTRDVLGILMVQGAALDRSYVERWVVDLQLQNEWARVLELERAENESA